MTARISLRLRREPDKRRLLTALRGGRPDAVPYLDLAFAPHIVDAVLGRTGSPDYGRLDPESAVEFACRAGMDAVYMSYTCPVGRIYRDLADGSRQYVDGSIKSPHQLDGLTLPPIEPMLARLDALCRAARGAGLAVIVGIDSPYKAIKIAVGFQDFLLAVYDRPQFLVRFRDWMTAQLGSVLQRILEYPIDVLMTAGDLCCSTGPMADPAFLDTFWTANMRDFLAPARRRALPVILHMDGDFSSILEMMAATGAAAIHPFEVTGTLDIHAVQAQLRGRMAVMGNIDCAGVLIRGTPAEVRHDVRQHLDRLAPAGGYVCGSSHELGPDAPIENFQALVEAVHEFGGNYGCPS